MSATDENNQSSQERSWSLIISIVCNIFLSMLFIGGAAFFCFRVYEDYRYNKITESGRHIRSILTPLIEEELKGQSKQSIIDRLESGRMKNIGPLEYRAYRGTDESESKRIECVFYAGMLFVFIDEKFAIFNTYCSLARPLENNRGL